MKILKRIVSVLLFSIALILSLGIFFAVIKAIGTFGKVETAQLIGQFVGYAIIALVDLLVIKIAIGLWRGEGIKKGA